MKKKIILFIGIFCCIFTNTNIYAAQYTVNGTLGAGGSYSTTSNILGDYYKYIKIVITPKKDAKYTVSLIGASSVSNLGKAKALNPSIEISTKANQSKTIYIIPRSGMSCPNDSGSYCFGTGTNLSGKTVIQGNECDGKMCPVYGIRVKNKRTFTSYDFKMTFEFIK